MHGSSTKRDLLWSFRGQLEISSLLRDAALKKMKKGIRELIDKPDPLPVTGLIVLGRP